MGVASKTWVSREYFIVGRHGEVSASVYPNIVDPVAARHAIITALRGGEGGSVRYGTR